MAHKNIITRDSILLFIIGLAVGGALGASLHKETLVVRQSVADTPAAMTSVNLMIDYGSSTVKTWNTVSWHEAMSVLMLMESVANAHAIVMMTKNNKDGQPTLDSIDGVTNDAKTNMRWQYWVNNTYEPRTAAKYFLKPGDIVEWKYVKEQPK